MKYLVKRFFAGIFDLSLLCLFLYAVVKVHGAARWIVFFGVIILWLEVCWRAKGSFGKILFNLGVTYSSRGSVLLRELVGKSACWVTLGLGYVGILFPERKGLDDYIASTTVVDMTRAKSWVDTLRLTVAVVGSITVAAVFFSSGGGTAPVGVTPATVAVHPWSVSDAMPAVMTINVYKGHTLKAQGSGFLIDSDGRAITNVHVLRDGDNAEVQLGDGRKFPITSVVAFDPVKDLALFKIGAAGATFPKLTLGASKDINIGERVIVIGSPEGLNNTVSEGILSALRPQTKDEQALMQVSAPISPGSSGGPVFDNAGGVVGVAQSTLEEGQNLNFAIPVEAVVALVHSPALNISPAEFYSRMLKLPNDDDDDSEQGSETAPSPGTGSGKSSPSTQQQPSAPSGHEVSGTIVSGSGR